MFYHSLRPGVELRPIEDRHAPAIWDLIERDRTRLREWLPWVDNSKSIEDVRTWARTTLDQFAANEGYNAGIWVDNRFAGVVGSHKLNWLYRKIELGYWLGSEFVGRGLMTDAVRALTTHAFVGWELHRVEIWCAAGNERSCTVARRLGFVEEGVHREAQLLNGRYVDLRVFAMLAQDWPAMQAVQNEPNLSGHPN